jgi:hypothetical protein
MDRPVREPGKTPEWGVELSDGCPHNPEVFMSPRHASLTPTGRLRLARCIIGLRVSRRWGPVQISSRLRLNPSTVHKVLVRYGAPPLAWTDPATGAWLRGKPKPQRYEHETPSASPRSPHLRSPPPPRCTHGGLTSRPCTQPLRAEQLGHHFLGTIAYRVWWFDCPGVAEPHHVRLSF